MPKKTYNKLVRDLIPDIIKLQGNIPIVSVLSEKEIVGELGRKLLEETNEYLLSGDLEELVDVYQVLLAILDESGIAFEQFEKLRQEKAYNRGEFKKRLYLSYVEEKRSEDGSIV